MTARTRVAVVGAGWWGSQHLRALGGLRDVEVVGVCGRDEARTAKRGARFGVRPYTDLDGLLAETSPDVVVVCLPNQAHYEPTLRILRQGYAVVSEKPLVFDLAEADALIEEAKRRSLFFAVVFNHRYARAVGMAKEAIAAGRIGDPVLATWRFGGEGPADHPHGNLIETQCHGFDQLEQLCGPIATVAAAFSERDRSGSSTTIAISLEFTSGAVGSVVGSYDDSYAHAGSHVLEVVGTSGRVLIEDTVRRCTISTHGSETSEVWEPGYFNDRDRQFMQTLDLYLADAVRALRAGEPPPVPATDGRRALQLAYAAIESARTGQRTPCS